MNPQVELLSIQPPAASNPLPVFLTIRLAVRNLASNSHDFIALAAIPMLLDIAVTLIYTLVPAGSANDLGFFTAANLLQVVHAFLTLFFLSIFSVAWFRHQITGRRERGTRFQFVVGRRELRYYFYFTVFALSLFIPPVLLASLAIPLAHMTGEPGITLGAISALLVIVCVTIAVRASLAFPAMAMGRDRGYAASWQQTKGSSWRLFSVLLVLILPAVAFYALIAQIESGGVALVVILLAATKIVAYLQCALIAAALALAYTWLVQSWDRGADVSD